MLQHNEKKEINSTLHHKEIAYGERLFSLSISKMIFINFYTPSFQEILSRTIAFNVTINFRITAVMATFAAFPEAMSLR